MRKPFQECTYCLFMENFLIDLGFFCLMTSLSANVTKEHVFVLQLKTAKIQSKMQILEITLDSQIDQNIKRNA